MIDWLEEVLGEGELGLDLPLTEAGAVSFRRAAVVTEEEPVPVRKTAETGFGGGPELTAFSRLGEESPLMALYRRAGETLGVTPPSAPARREVVVRETTVSPPGLTVRELDLAVRRDSRRYDGGMNLY